MRNKGKKEILEVSAKCWSLPTNMGVFDSMDTTLTSSAVKPNQMRELSVQLLNNRLLNKVQLGDLDSINTSLTSPVIKPKLMRE